MLWLIGIVLFLLGCFQLLQGQLVFGIILIVVGLGVAGYLGYGRRSGPP